MDWSQGVPWNQKQVYRSEGSLKAMHNAGSENTVGRFKNVICMKELDMKARKEAQLKVRVKRKDHLLQLLCQ